MRLWKVIEMNTPQCRANERSINKSDNESLRNQRLIEIALDQRLRTLFFVLARQGSESGAFARSVRHIWRVTSLFKVMYMSSGQGVVGS
jgi:hypothetical protein